VLTNLYGAFYLDFLATHSYVMNPFGVEGAIGEFTPYEYLVGSALVGEVLLLTSTLAAPFSLVLRLHHAQGDERQQLKWFLYATVPAVGCFSFVLFAFIVVDFTDLFPFSSLLLELRELLPSWDNYYGIVSVGVFSLLVVPVFTYIAILRYHLYDIDVVINRTLVYGALSACVVGIYVLTIVAFGALFRTQGNIAVSLLATGLVAVLFQPLRSRLQRGVNRLMYGERDDPYAVISRLGRRLEATLAPDTVLPTLVETIAQALKLPYVAILLKEGEDYRTAASYGSPRGE
jgi:hypothetical protein